MDVVADVIPSPLVMSHPTDPEPTGIQGLFDKPLLVVTDEDGR